MPKPTPKPPATATAAIRVTSAREGFRRAGRPWSAQPITVPVAEFTAEQLAQLRAEPMLTVEDIG